MQISYHDLCLLPVKDSKYIKNISGGSDTNCTNLGIDAEKFGNDKQTIDLQWQSRFDIFLNSHKCDVYSDVKF